jgi:uncharacterized protein YdaU (DUF1376 family)
VRRLSVPDTPYREPAKERSRTLPYFKWWYVDHRSHRLGRTLTALEDGILLRLLEEQWMEGAIPDDYNRLAEIAGVSPSVIADAWVKLAKLFPPMPGAEGALLRNRRLEKERTEADALRVKRAVAGSMGGRPRKQTKANDSNGGQAEMFGELPGGIRLPSHDMDAERKANESNGKQAAQESRAVAEQSSSAEDGPCRECGGPPGFHRARCDTGRLLARFFGNVTPAEAR